MTTLRFTALALAAFLGIALTGCADSNPAQPSGPNTTTRSFQTDIKPILTKYGCTGCHGGSGGLELGSAVQLVQGGMHGPAAVPGKADSSIIVMKISSTPPFGDRMPLGGSKVVDEDAQAIKDWINQGAIDN